MFTQSHNQTRSNSFANEAFGNYSISQASAASIPFDYDRPSPQKLIDYLRAECIRLLILDSHSRALSASYGPSAVYPGALVGQDMPTLLIRAKQNVWRGLEEKVRMTSGEEELVVEKLKEMQQEMSLAFVELDSRWRGWTENATRPPSF